jgi:hypothetical protein
VVERGVPVDVPLVPYRETGRVLDGGVADVHVGRATGDVDDRIVGERVTLVGEIEDAFPRRVLDPGAVEIAFRRAGLGGEAAAAGLEEEEDLLRAGLVHPKAELRPVGALAGAVGDDALPRLIAGRSRGRPRRRRDGPRIVVPAARGERDRQRG